MHELFQVLLIGACGSVQVREVRLVFRVRRRLERRLRLVFGGQYVCGGILVAGRQRTLQRCPQQQ